MSDTKVTIRDVMGTLKVQVDDVERNENKNMNIDNKLLDLYVKRKRETINNKYRELVEKEYESLDVVKEYNELVNTFETSLAEMANKYNTEENKMIIKTGYFTSTYPYKLSCELLETIKIAYNPTVERELRELDLLIEEVNAQLSLSEDKDYQIEILKRYEIINKKGKLSI